MSPRRRIVVDYRQAEGVSSDEAEAALRRAYKILCDVYVREVAKHAQPASDGLAEIRREQNQKN
jgi:hypothetical protein